MMNEFEQDALLTDAFGEFSTVAAPSVRSQGTMAVRGEVAHRRKMRAITLSVVAALTIALPVAAYAALGRTPQGPPQPAGPATAAPSVSPSVSASAVPSASPSKPAASSDLDGRISLAQLSAATLTVPKWVSADCDHTSVKFQRVDDPQHYVGKYGVYQIAYANLDADPALETAALFTCKLGEASQRQVVALDRDAAGKIVMLGRVTGGVAWSVQANPAGGVDVDESDIQVCCDTPRLMVLHQTRTYGWDGTRIVQTGGPTAYTSHGKPTDLKVAVKKVVPGAVKGYTRTLTITVTVTNNGPYASNKYVVYEDQGGLSKPVERTSLGVGKSTTFSFTAAVDQYQRSGFVALYELGTQSIGLDAHPDDNRVRYSFAV